jgi:hypothetical protein
MSAIQKKFRRRLDGLLTADQRNGRPAGLTGTDESVSSDTGRFPRAEPDFRLWLAGAHVWKMRDTRRPFGALGVSITAL